jgi:gliding motility-associated-like protein
LPVGNYNLIAKNGSDGNTVWDLCDNGIPVNETIPFTILSPLPVPFDSLRNNICSTDSVILVFPDLIKCNSVAPNGSDFFVTGTYPVTITNAQPINCIGGLTRQVAVHFASTLFQPANFQIVLRAGTDGNTLLSECDTPSVAGSAIPFKILPKPVANFTFTDTVCLPLGKMIFANLSKISDGSENAFRYLWNFDDTLSGANNTSTQKTPTHFYSNTGPYRVTLKVTSNAGCIKDTLILANTIHRQPQINFGISRKDICLEDAVFLTDSTINTDGYLNYWYWDLGDGKIKNTQNVLYIYTSAKIYNVSLYTINNYGCRSETLSKPVTVHSYPTANAGPDRKVLEGGSLTIQALATGTGLQYVWTPPQYLNNTTILTPKCIEPKFDMLYTLTVTGAGGCFKTDDMFVDVLKIPNIPNTFTPNGDGKNDSWIIEYLDEYISNHLQVFTRTGQLVFESRGMYKAWDGTYKGKALPMDTYYYIIEPGSGREPVTGYVTIVK